VLSAVYLSIFAPVTIQHNRSAVVEQKARNDGGKMGIKTIHFGGNSDIFENSLP
jgi:hypothetical protein